MGVAIKTLRENGGSMLMDRAPELNSVSEYDGPETAEGQSDKKFKFELVQFHVQCATGQAVPMHSAGAVALGLTEACMRMGSGKVFWTPKPDATERAMSKGYCELPELLYVDYKWTNEDADEWLTLSYVDRLRVPNACAGGVETESNILPISMRLEENEDERIRLNATKQCDVALYIDGAIYMGLYVDMLVDASHELGDVGKMATNWVYKRDRKDFRYHSLHSVVEKMEKLLQTSQTVTIHDDFIDTINKAYQDWRQEAVAAVDTRADESSTAI